MPHSEERPTAEFVEALERIAAVLAVDPWGMGGVWVRGPIGPERDSFVGAVLDHAPDRPLSRIPAGIAPDRLIGGLSVAESVRSGRRVVRPGLLAEADGGWVVLTGVAADTATVAPLLEVLDRGRVQVERHGVSRDDRARVGVIALDEARPDEGPSMPDALLDRLAFWVVVPPRLLVPRGRGPILPDQELEQVRLRAGLVKGGTEAADSITLAAAALGVDSMRAPILALRAARISAALRGADRISEDDLVFATATVLSPRGRPVEASVQPQPEPHRTEGAEPDAPSGPPPPPDDRPTVADDEFASETTSARRMADRLVQASRALLPEIQLAPPRSGGGGRGRQGASSRLRRPVRRGRVKRVAPGTPGPGRPVDVLATILTAAPRQALRSGASSGRLVVLPEDIRVRHLEAPARRSTLFIVDASGSHAMNRLAEAKGAIELLLADSYVRREEIGLVVFRDRTARLALAPTRSPARARRVLAGLPGGGGTPLAAGLLLGLRQAGVAKRDGKDPALVVITDGKANVALDGRGGRDRALADALQVARIIAREGLPLMVLDTSPRGQAQTEALASAGSGSRARLPTASPASVRASVRALDPRGVGKRA